MNVFLEETENRPWGEFRVFTKNQPVTVKIIKVTKGEQFSLQYHKNRSEFWKILSGNPEVTVGESVVVAQKGDEFVVPQGTTHRVHAPTEDVEFLEIASGNFDEEDIIRLEDNYGRI